MVLVCGSLELLHTKKSPLWMEIGTGVPAGREKSKLGMVGHLFLTKKHETVGFVWFSGGVLYVSSNWVNPQT